MRLIFPASVYICLSPVGSLYRCIFTNFKRREKMFRASKMRRNNDVDQWLDLPSGPVGNIFSFLNPADVLLVVPFVCSYWGKIFLQTIFCKNDDNCLDFSPLIGGKFYTSFYFGNENSRAMNLMKLLVGVMHAFASDGLARVTSITFPVGLRIYDRHLIYVAERCPGLKKLIIPCAENITGKGISRAMQYWNQMEVMTYGLAYHPCQTNKYLTHTIEEFGNCKNLHFLTLRGFEFQWRSAPLIAHNLKYLSKLVLHDAIISKYGLQKFLTGCNKNKNFEELGISYCCFKGLRCYALCFEIYKNQEGRRTKWRTNFFPNKVGESYTAKELVNLLWQWEKIDI